MKERQHTKHGIFRTDFYPCEYSFDFTKQVGMSQYDALRVGSRARCIEKGSNTVLRHTRRLKRLWPGRENRIEISSCGAGALAREAARIPWRLSNDHLDLQVRDCLLR